MAESVQDAVDQLDGNDEKFTAAVAALSRSLARMDIAAHVSAAYPEPQALLQHDATNDFVPLVPEMNSLSSFMLCLTCQGNGDPHNGGVLIQWAEEPNRCLDVAGGGGSGTKVQFGHVGTATILTNNSFCQKMDWGKLSGLEIQTYAWILRGVKLSGEPTCKCMIANMVVITLLFRSLVKVPSCGVTTHLCAWMWTVAAWKTGPKYRYGVVTRTTRTKSSKSIVECSRRVM